MKLECSLILKNLFIKKGNKLIIKIECIKDKKNYEVLILLEV